MRIFPGRLSVSRSFGDVEAKIVEFGGNPNVLIALPEIKAFKIKKEHDFVVLGCDGIFDRISNREAVQLVWNAANDVPKLYQGTKTIH
jgi:protein phosphatase 2C family protein 2/3